MNVIVKRPAPPRDLREEYIRAMWVRFLLAPGHKTGPGEPVDLGEIGTRRSGLLKDGRPIRLLVRQQNVASLTFDTGDVRVRWMFYRYHNRCHDGEIWLAFQTTRGILLMEQSERWPDGVLLGEVQTRIVADKFEDCIVPVAERSETELQRMREQAEAHKAYRAALWRRSQ
jgi:hypothetical protein